MLAWRRLRLALVVSAALLCACASARPVLEPSAAYGRSVPGPGEPAARYETVVGPGPAVRDDARHSIERAIRAATAAHGAKLEGDPRLRSLSEWVALHLSEDGSLPAQEALDQAAHQLGLVEPTPHFAVLATDDTREAAAQLGEDVASMLREHAYSHYGGAALNRDGGAVYVVALVFRFLQLAPVPRASKAGAPIELRGRLDAGFTHAELAVTRPDGQVLRGPRLDGSKFEFRIATETRGMYRVEILGQSEQGEAVVANFPVYVDQRAPDRVDLPATEPAIHDSAQAARYLLELINRDRVRAGKSPLRLNAQLSSVAAAHDEDMLAHGFVGHISKRTGGAADRVARAGIRTSLVLENIGRGYSLNEVHSGLMSSPGHRGNILHALATDVGIGVAVQSEDAHVVYLVTEVFIRVTPPLPERAVASLYAAIDAQRAQHGGRSLQRDRALAAAAQRAADRCFEQGQASDEAVMTTVRGALPGLAGRARQVSALLSVASSLAQLSRLPAVLDPHVRTIGLGLSQGDRPDAAPNAICAVYLLGQ